MKGTRLETVRMVDREEVGQEKDQEERLEQESQVKDFRVRQVLTRSEMVEAAPELPPLERMVVSVLKYRLSQPRLQPLDRSDTLAVAKFTSQAEVAVVKEI